MKYLLFLIVVLFSSIILSSFVSSTVGSVKVIDSFYYDYNDVWESSCNTFPQLQTCQQNKSALGVSDDQVVQKGGSVDLLYSYRYYLSMVCISLPGSSSFVACAYTDQDYHLHNDPQACIDRYSDVKSLYNSHPEYFTEMDEDYSYWFQFSNHYGNSHIKALSSNNNYYINTNNLGNYANIRATYFVDCENYMGNVERGVAPRTSVKVIGKKGQYCDGNTSVSVFYDYNNNSFLTTQENISRINCEYVYKNVSIGYCDEEASFNTSILTSTWSVYESLLDDHNYYPNLCVINLTKMHSIEAEQGNISYLCYNNIQDEDIGETNIDYGGQVCGYCDETAMNKEDDQGLILAYAMHPYGYYGVLNPFDKNDCQEARESFSSISSIIIIILIIFFSIIIFFLGIVFYLFFLGLTSSFYVLYKFVRKLLDNSKKK